MCRFPQISVAIPNEKGVSEQSNAHRLTDNVADALRSNNVHHDTVDDYLRESLADDPTHTLLVTLRWVCLY